MENDIMSGLEYFEDKINDLVSNNIYISPPSFRVDKPLFYKNNKNLENKKIDDKDIFNIDNITDSYLCDLKNEVFDIKENIDINKFENFKYKYTAIPYNLYNLSIKANSINKDYPNMLNDITEFLYDNGIILLVKQRDNYFKYLDGFACFLGKYPIIVIYKPQRKEDYRRMFFTIAHEIYHLIYVYTENEKDADFFAGKMLVTQENILKILNNMNDDNLKKNNVNEISIFLKDNKKIQEKIFYELYKYLNVSMRVILKALLGYKFILGSEEEYQSLIDNLINKLKENKIIMSDINIISTKDFLTNKKTIKD